MFTRQGLRFREVDRRDLDSLRQHRNEEETWSKLTDPWPVFSQEAWFASLGSSRLAFMVEDADYGKVIGFARLDEIDKANRSVRIGCDVFSAWRRRGYGKRIMAGLLDWCFGEIGMHRCWLLVLATNEPAICLYEQVGFRHEGRQKEAIWRDGGWRDYLMMRVLQTEWRESRRTTA